MLEQQAQNIKDKNPRIYVFIINPAGQNGNAMQIWKKLYPQIQQELQQYGDVKQYITKKQGDGRNIARKSIYQGAYAVISVGGDGTAHDVINGFFENGKLIYGPSNHKTIFGIIPIGTGSDLCRTLQIRDQSDALKVIYANQTKQIYVGEATWYQNQQCSEIFINAASSGITSLTAYYAQFFKYCGSISYYFAALISFLIACFRNFEVVIDSQKPQKVSQCTAITCGRGKYVGGGFKLTPFANIFEPELNVVHMQGYRIFDFVYYEHALRQGQHLNLPRVKQHFANKVKISIEGIEVNNVKLNGNRLKQNVKQNEGQDQDTQNNNHDKDFGIQQRKIYKNEFWELDGENPFGENGAPMTIKIIQESVPIFVKEDINLKLSE